MATRAKQKPGWRPSLAPAPGSLGYNRGQIVLARAHLLIATGKIEEALQELLQINAISQEQASVTWQIEALTLQALAWHRKGDLEHAFTCLEKALSLGEAEGYLGSFLDGGKPIQQLLKGLSTRLEDPNLTGYCQRLLSAFTAEFSSTPLDQHSLLTPLSRRELELLRLIAEGRTNREIANELVITVGTVKRHVIHILTKLNVGKRTEAVAKARLLNLL